MNNAWRLCFLNLMLLSTFSVSAEMTTCTLTYNLKGWSFIFKDYSGTGHIRCRNGERADVLVKLQGGGFTIGRSEINNGHGVISSVKNIGEIYGTYAFMDGHIGVTQSVEGRVLTKGLISLALSGLGRGLDIGVSLGAFIISPIDKGQ